MEFELARAKKIIVERLSSSRYIVQTVVEQHPTLNSIYNKSINTLRLITLYDKRTDDVIPISASLRIGANGNTVDNWAKGGLAVGIDLQSGKLKKYGFYKHGFGTKTSKHPNSDFVFENLQLPDYNMAIKNAIKLHKKIKDIPIIGWDIAFSTNGPIFIEGNDNMDVSLNQVANSGLKKKFEQHMFHF